MQGVAELPSDQAPAMLRHAFEALAAIHGGLPAALEIAPATLVQKFPFLVHQACSLACPPSPKPLYEPSAHLP
jgi:creatinine amidohydrolase/Fe(II)-dependent formamide hydrolase-like protein